MVLTISGLHQQAQALFVDGFHEFSTRYQAFSDIQKRWLHFFIGEEHMQSATAIRAWIDDLRGRGDEG